MKFASALQRNTLPEWQSYYVHYSGLKKIIHFNRAQFLDCLQVELYKVSQFYSTIRFLLYQMISKEHWESSFNHIVHPTIQSYPIESTVPTMPYLHATNDLTRLYHYISHLQNYAYLNYTGFRKICKKYNKTNKQSITSFLDTIKASDWWLDDLDILKSAVVAQYASITMQSHTYCAKLLESSMDDLVMYNKSTVWQEEQVTTVKNWRDTFQMQLHSPVYMTLVHCTVSLGLLYLLPLLPPVVHFTNHLDYQGRCLGVLLCVIYLWATEAMPLYVTSLLLPLLVVINKVLVQDDKVLDAPDAAQLIFTQYFYSPIIPLLLGGFTMASALSKYRVLQAPCAAAVKQCKGQTHLVLFVLMQLGTVMSGIVSNVAAPVLCVGLIHPILKRCRWESRIGKALVVGIAMSCNIGGMMTPIASPQNIITVHLVNASWWQWLSVSVPVCFLSNLLIFWWIIQVIQPDRQIPMYQGPDTNVLNDMNIDTSLPPQDRISSNEPSEVPSEHSEHSASLLHTHGQRPFWYFYDSTQWIILVSSGIVLALWVMTPVLEQIVGNMSMISMIPIVFYFGCGYLEKNDFHDLLWTVVILAQGGVLLGKTVENTGLLHVIAQSWTAFMAHWTILEMFVMTILMEMEY